MKHKSILYFLMILGLLFGSVSCTQDNQQHEHTDNKDGGDNQEGNKKEEPVFTALSADGYTTVSDVTIHNKVPSDIYEIEQLLSKSPVDWAAVKKMYVEGKHSVKSDGSVRTLNGFAANGENFSKYSPTAAEYFKTNGLCQKWQGHGVQCKDGKFVDEYLESFAIDGKGFFKDVDDKVRAAAVKSSLLINMAYWVRLELGKTMAKAKDGNYEPHAGAPHNWDEAFAFYWGPDGKHSLYAYAASLETKYGIKNGINKAIMELLVAGLERLKKNENPVEESAKIVLQLERIALLGMLSALTEMKDGKDKVAKNIGKANGTAFWLGVGYRFKGMGDLETAALELFAGDSAKDETIKGWAAKLAAKVKDLGFTKDDFGTALP